MDTFERLKKIFLENTDGTVDEALFTDEARLAEDLGCDSVTLLYMAMSLEEEFDISFSNSDLMAFKTVRGTVDIIDKLIAAKAKK